MFFAFWQKYMSIFTHIWYVCFCSFVRRSLSDGMCFSAQPFGSALFLRKIVAKHGNRSQKERFLRLAIQLLIKINYSYKIIQVLKAYMHFSTKRVLFLPLSSGFYQLNQALLYGEKADNQFQTAPCPSPAFS